MVSSPSRVGCGGVLQPVRCCSIVAQLQVPHAVRVAVSLSTLTLALRFAVCCMRASVYVQYLFKSPASAQNIMIFINVRPTADSLQFQGLTSPSCVWIVHCFCGDCVFVWVVVVQIGSLFLIMASFILGFIPSTCEANKGLQYIFNFLPSYALGKGLINVRACPHPTSLACYFGWCWHSLCLCAPVLSFVCRWRSLRSCQT